MQDPKKQALFIRYNDGNALGRIQPTVLNAFLFTLKDNILNDDRLTSEYE